MMYTCVPFQVFFLDVCCFFGEDEFMLAKIGSKIGYAGDVP